MAVQTNLGGTFTLPGTSIRLHRMGYGAMQLAGPQVWGPPRDRNAALSVLRAAVALGVIESEVFFRRPATSLLVCRRRAASIERRWSASRPAP